MSLPLYIGLRYTSSRRRNQLLSFLSVISICGLVVGVALLVLVLSVMNGFDRELRERILSLVPQAAIYHKRGIEDWPLLQKQLEQDPEVIAAAPFVQLEAAANHEGNTSPLRVYGVDPSSELRVSLVAKFVDPEVLHKLSEQSPTIILGKGLADKLKAQVGDAIMLIVPDSSGNNRAAKFSTFTVSAVLNSRTQLDASIALVSLAHAQNLSDKPDSVSGMRLKLLDLFNASQVVYRQQVTLGAGYYASTWMRVHGNLYHAIHMSKSLVGLLMSLIVAIAAFNVVSTLVMVVSDKQGDIAILRTLGMSTKNIVGIFMVQGSAIGALGTALGLAIGCGMSLVLEDFVRWVEGLFALQFLKSDVYPLTYLPTQINVMDLIWVGALALALSFLAALYPAWRAARVQPAVALRYE